MSKEKKIIVQKFGGTSVGDINKIKKVADIIAQSSLHSKVVVVVSAMGDTTDELLAKIMEIVHPNSQEELAEYDTVLSAGEQISIGLLALALRARNIKARSYLGWQLPILTDNSFSEGRILDIKLDNFYNSLENDEIPIIAGFQGTYNNRITTLGRGGSDTTAVSIAGALQAKCEIYTDVDGVYTADPRIVSKARRLQYLSYGEILEMASSGAQVLHPRAAAIAMRYRIDVKILSTFSSHGEDCGTTLVLKRKDMETNSITAVISDYNLARISLCNINFEQKTHILSKIIDDLDKNNILVDHMFHQEYPNIQSSDLHLIIDNDHLIRAQNTLESLKGKFYDEIMISEDIAVISVIGIGISNNLSVVAKALAILDDHKIKVSNFSTSETKLVLIIDSADREMAVRALHSGLNLDLANNH